MGKIKHFVTDFDETLTYRDTTPVIAELALNATADETERSQRGQLWEATSKRYFQGAERVNTKLNVMPLTEEELKEMESTSSLSLKSWDGTTKAALLKLLTELGEFEQEASKWLSESGSLAGKRNTIQ